MFALTEEDSQDGEDTTVDERTASVTGSQSQEALSSTSSWMTETASQHDDSTIHTNFTGGNSRASHHSFGPWFSKVVNGRPLLLVFLLSFCVIVGVVGIGAVVFFLPGGKDDRLNLATAGSDGEPVSPSD